MKVSDLMSDITTNPAFEGVVMADDYILAIDISVGGTAAYGDYVVAQSGIEGVDSSLNGETSETQTLRAGKSSTRTGVQRKFTVSGYRYTGDPFQDYILSHAIKYGTGQTVIKPYIYFNMLTGKGEKGTVNINVTSDGGGKSGEKSTINVELSKTGAAPEEFTYSSTAVSTKLASLAIGSLTLSPSFDGDVTAYTAETTGTTDTITAAAVDSTNADVSILVNGTAIESGDSATWTSGANTVIIVVSNGTATPTTYMVSVTKSST